MKDVWDNYVFKFPGMDLVALQLGFVDFALGLSLWLALPTFKIYLDSEKWYRCFQLHFGALFFFIEINIPLYFDFEAGEPK